MTDIQISEPQSNIIPFPDASQRGGFDFEPLLFRIRFDNMAPTLERDDFAVIDCRQTTFDRSREEGIYALRHEAGGTLDIRRLIVIGGTKRTRVKVIYDNPIWTPYETAIDALPIVGRVVGMMRHL